MFLSECNQFGYGGLLGESSDLEIRTVNPQQKFGVFIDCAFVVRNPGAIRGTDFAQNRAGLGHHIRNAERAANFDQLSAGDDDFASFGKSVQRKQNGSSIIVDDDGGDGLRPHWLCGDGRPRPSGRALPGKLLC